MIALQKYWKTKQTKMYMFTSFIGLMAVMLLLLSLVTIAKDGLAQALSESIVITGLLDFPATFIFLLMMHRVFAHYVEGQFFSTSSLQTLLVTAKLAIFYGLVLKPSVIIGLTFIAKTQPIEILSYFSHASFSIAVVGYVLHLGVSAHKVSREIEQEQELTV